MAHPGRRAFFGADLTHACRAMLPHDLDGLCGLFAARAAIETGRRVAITEHGIYTNERRIDLTSAEWIADSVAFSLEPDR